MKYVPIPVELFPDVIIHLRNTFFPDEPLNRSVNLCTIGEEHTDLEQHSWCTMEDGLSVMALSDDNEIAGVCLNGVVRPGDFERGLSKLKHNPDDRFTKIFRLLYEENLKLDLFRRYGVDRIFELRMLSVDAKFRGQGVARQLMEHSEKIAIEHGFQVLKGEATGVFSQKILCYGNFNTIGEAAYKSRYNADGTPMFPVEAPHESLKIMIKRVAPKEE